MDFLSTALLVLIILLCVVGLYIACLHRLLKNDAQQETLLTEEVSTV
jgi:hypothetical protein